VNQEDKNNASNFCIKYPHSKGFVYIKIVFFFSLIIIFGYGVIDFYQSEKTFYLIVFCFILIAIVETMYHQIYRIKNVNEICFENSYLIIKKNKYVQSKTNLQDIEVIQKRPWFEFFGISWIIIKNDEKWLFQYSTSELSEEDNEKLINRLKQGVKSWQIKR
jgi:hypothetical protein